MAPQCLLTSWRTLELLSTTKFLTNIKMLNNLPIEIVEMIVQLLELHDICNLRLSGRSIADLASQGYFQIFFLEKKLTLPPQQVEKLKTTVHCSQLVPLLRDLELTFRYVYYKHGEDENQTAQSEELSSLVDLFETLRSALPEGRLSTLRLSMSQGVISKRKGRTPDRPWSPRHLVEAVTNFNIMLALQRTCLPIGRLDIFTRGRRCSLVLDAIGRIPDLHLLSPSLLCLKSLSIKLCRPLDPKALEFSPRTTANRLLTVRSSIAAFGNLLSLMPALEELDLHWYNLHDTYDEDQEVADSEAQRFFDQVSETLCSSPLKSITLRGVHVAQQPLVAFLQATSAMDLDLRDVHLHEGDYQPIFGELFHAQSCFERVHLEDLWEETPDGEKLLHFDTAGESKVSYLHDAFGPSELIRQGHDVQTPLRYKLAGSRALGSPGARSWRQRRLAEYGPPPRNG